MTHDISHIRTISNATAKFETFVPRHLKFKRSIIFTTNSIDLSIMAYQFAILYPEIGRKNVIFRHSKLLQLLPPFFYCLNFRWWNVERLISYSMKQWTWIRIEECHHVEILSLVRSLLVFGMRKFAVICPLLSISFEFAVIFLKTYGLFSKLPNVLHHFEHSPSLWLWLIRGSVKFESSR